MMLQCGIGTVRGVGDPKIDLIILLELNRSFADRTKKSIDPIESELFDDRSQTIFESILKMLRKPNSDNEPSYLFKYNGTCSYFEIEAERKLNVHEKLLNR